jgi:hypothetical protein
VKEPTALSLLTNTKATANLYVSVVVTLGAKIVVEVPDTKPPPSVKLAAATLRKAYIRAILFTPPPMVIVIVPDSVPSLIL